MLRLLKKWFGTGSTPAGQQRAAPSRDLSSESGIHESPVESDSPAEPEFVELDPSIDGHIEELGPGKNVLVRNRYQREETGTYETLKIVDDSVVDSGEETGIDPYNTGNFDRSKNWDKRFRN